MARIHRRTIQDLNDPDNHDAVVTHLDSDILKCEVKEALRSILISPWASVIAQLVKNLPAMEETPVRFLGQEDPLEKGQATHSSILGLPWCLSW